MKFPRIIMSLLLVCSFALAAEVAEKEPTNAEEAAQKKAQEDAELAGKFAAWKATVSPAQQKWETILEQNLGNFYLPLYQKDRLAGRATAWDYLEDDPKLPRVLLIGDSISRGYTLATRKALAGRANVHRAPENCGPTANGLKKLEIYLGDEKWDVIHFNFGIHDRATPTADYQDRLEKIVTRLEATKAKLIWASSTPIPPDTQYGDLAVIVRKNEEAAAIMRKRGVAIDDIYTAILPHVDATRNKADVHFSEDGYRLMGAQVAQSIEQALK
jgi:hypothetical protein